MVTLSVFIKATLQKKADVKKGPFGKTVKFRNEALPNIIYIYIYIQFVYLLTKGARVQVYFPAT